MRTSGRVESKLRKTVSANLFTSREFTSVLFTLHIDWCWLAWKALEEDSWRLRYTSWNRKIIGIGFLVSLCSFLFSHFLPPASLLHHSLFASLQYSVLTLNHLVLFSSPPSSISCDDNHPSLQLSDPCPPFSPHIASLHSPSGTGHPDL